MPQSTLLQSSDIPTKIVEPGTENQHFELGLEKLTRAERRVARGAVFAQFKWLIASTGWPCNETLKVRVHFDSHRTSVRMLRGHMIRIKDAIIEAINARRHGTSFNSTIPRKHSAQGYVKKRRPIARD